MASSRISKVAGEEGEVQLSLSFESDGDTKDSKAALPSSDQQIFTRSLGTLGALSTEAASVGGKEGAEKDESTGSWWEVTSGLSREQAMLSRLSERFGGPRKSRRSNWESEMPSPIK